MKDLLKKLKLFKSHAGIGLATKVWILDEEEFKALDKVIRTVEDCIEISNRKEI